MDGTLADGDWALVDRSHREPKLEGGLLWFMANAASSACSAPLAGPGC
ncbi:hypothetical protein [Halomonas sp. 328]|nr:hypothetical protein [Halomonas sp. 328]MBF8224526.1 hypothetical protein [Halomonas sp. 328]